MLEQGPTEQKILQQSLRMRQPIPQAIQNAPRLWLGLELYFEAWMDLNTCRDYGMGAGPIPWIAVHEYARRYGLDDEQFEALQHHIVSMDRTYEDWREKKAKAAQNVSKGVLKADKADRPQRGA